MQDDILALRAYIDRPQAERSSFPLHVSELEEDIEFLKGTGVLDVAQASMLLRELEFEDAEVTFDASAGEVFDDTTLN